MAARALYELLEPIREGTRTATQRGLNCPELLCRWVATCYSAPQESWPEPATIVTEASCR